jgi:hypothetical protein
MTQPMSSKDTTMGPYRVLVRMHDGEMAARKIAYRWNLDCHQDEIL